MSRQSEFRSSCLNFRCGNCAVISPEDGVQIYSSRLGVQYILCPNCKVRLKIPEHGDDEYLGYIRRVRGFDAKPNGLWILLGLIYGICFIALPFLFAMIFASGLFFLMTIAGAVIGVIISIRFSTVNAKPIVLSVLIESD